MPPYHHANPCHHAIHSSPGVATRSVQVTWYPCQPASLPCRCACECCVCVRAGVCLCLVPVPVPVPAVSNFAPPLPLFPRLDLDRPGRALVRTCSPVAVAVPTQDGLPPFPRRVVSVFFSSCGHSVSVSTSTSSRKSRVFEISILDSRSPVKREALRPGSRPSRTSRTSLAVAIPGQQASRLAD